MSAYGWTLPEAMQITFPQVTVLMRAMRNQPPIGMLASALMKGLGEKKDDPNRLGGMGAVKKLTPEAFEKQLRGMVNG